MPSYFFLRLFAFSHVWDNYSRPAMVKSRSYQSCLG
nr:MAG TPA: hypothetical protein [Caudoviricetes sp.]